MLSCFKSIQAQGMPVWRGGDTMEYAPCTTVTAALICTLMPQVSSGALTVPLYELLHCSPVSVTLVTCAASIWGIDTA